MAALAVQSMRSLSAGLDPTLQAADVAGDTFVNDGRTFVHAENSDVAARTITIPSNAPCDQGFDHDAVVTIPAGGARIFGPFDINRFGQTVAMSYDAVTGLTVAARRA